MIKYLLKSTIEVRVESFEDAELLNHKMQEEAIELGGSLTSFNKAKKEIKIKGEVIDEYYVCKATITFDTAKEPEKAPLLSIDYNFADGEDLW